MKIRTLVLALLLIGAAGARAEIPTVVCPAEPPVVRRLQLHELWRIDADDPDAPLLGMLSPDAIAAHEGRIYLLDTQLNHVLVYGDDGSFGGTIMRRGQGPGEVENAYRMFLCRDGRLAVQHGYPTKLEFVATDGTPRGSWRLGVNAWAMKILEAPGGWLGVYPESRESDNPGEFLAVTHVALHDDDGARTRDFFAREHRSRHGQGTEDEAEEYLPWRTVAVTAAGELVYAPARDEYRIEWVSLDGEPLRGATREYAAHRRTQAEHDRAKYSSYSAVNDDVQFKGVRQCENDPVILELDPLPDGRLRVITSRFEKDGPAGMVCRYEVHGPDGALLERVEIFDPSGGYDTDYDAVALLDDDRVIVLRNLKPAYRANDANLPPKVREKLPPVPDAREEIALTPIVCELVPYAGGAE